MPLNEIQNSFVNKTARPHMETLVRILHQLVTFIEEYDAIQLTSYALPWDDTVLDDGRTDVPVLTGQDIKRLRDFSNTMNNVVGPMARQIMISLMVRNLKTVLCQN